MNKSNPDIQGRLRGAKPSRQKTIDSNKRFIELQSQIMKCLQRMDHQLLLVFKVSDYISSIDNKLGRPVNNFYYTAKYSFDRKIQRSKGMWQSLRFTYLKFKVLFCFRMYQALCYFGLAH